ncbi:MAG: alkaline phosphatase D family protein [Xanthobacteraceae bacterium]|nr:alkaline phosphatase D family protein [Xanthobacteraceae bacterium]
MNAFHFTRRSLLKVAGLTAAGVAAPSLLLRSTIAQAVNWPGGDPFSLGVASGTPSEDGFVLWTRLAPDPMSIDPDKPGGMERGPVAVDYEVATDDAMRNVIRRGTVASEPALAHSIHLEIAGLTPGRPYWYRFRSGSAVSRVGRAKTLPASSDKVDRLRFGFVSCANYEHGYFSAYRHLTEEDPDVVIFLGDYIYEVSNPKIAVRLHSGGEAATLSGYRNRYAQYRLDPDLQGLHASLPALITWDDHEVENDYASTWSPTFEEAGQFMDRRTAAYQAFYEHMPLRAASRPQGSSMRLYDRFKFGGLADISMVDGRQYRSREACYGPPKKGGAHLETNEACPERLEEVRSMLGREQEAWLFDGLSRSSAQWNVIAQDVLMAQFRQRTPDDAIGYWTDDWDGYPAARTRLLRHIADSKVRNPVVLSGDIHSFWANDLKRDFENPDSDTVATEFVGTSIASNGPPHDVFVKCLPDNPHVHFFESRKRGYSFVELTAKNMTTRFRAVSDVRKPDATIATLKTYVVEDGRPGAQEA